MFISIIGTNGLLATEIGLFCNNNNINVKAFGRREPERYEYNEFNKIDLNNDKLNIDSVLDSNIIYYTSGAGIQSNLNDPVSFVYHLNTFVPIDLCIELNKNGYQGTIVTFGSCFEIGNNNESFLYSERDIERSTLEVPNDYCVSKRLLTRYVSSSKKNSFKHLHIILPTIYGEKEAAHRLIPYAISSIKNNRQMQFTSGLQVRQYLYAGDVPKIVFDLVKMGKEGVFNISGNETFTVRKIVEMIYSYYALETSDDLFGKAERVDVGMLNLQIDDSKLKNILPSIEYTMFTDSLKIYDKCL
jgi:nucleoside-diphosphate-sugar epimerase